MRRICCDVHPPQRHSISLNVLSAIVIRGKQWQVGQEIPIYFMNGTQEEHEQVKEWVKEWEDVINLQFKWVDDPTASVRIHFDNSGASWSYIGNDALEIPARYPTMNFGWEIDKSTVLHEFGHMLGMGHEHQNPEGGIEWNEHEVIRDLSGAPNYWDEDTIRSNVLEKYRTDQVNGTEFDRESIMLYSFPGEWTVNLPAGTPWNMELSDVDKEFMASQYPGAPKPVVKELPVFHPQPHAADIGAAGEEDLYRFRVAEQGVYVVETTGSTDLTMNLLRGDQVLAFNDDGGARYNPRIEMSLSPGEYTVQIRHYSEDGTGEYKILVSRIS